jgi:hypothetical protein
MIVYYIFVFYLVLTNIIFSVILYTKKSGGASCAAYQKIKIKEEEKMKLYGSYYLLSVLPIWAMYLIMFIVVLGVLFILRDKYEGLYYNTSYSAVLGDGALVAVVLMAAGILQRGWVLLPTWAQGGYFHSLALVAGVILGIFWVMIDDPKQWGDKYHHLVIAPLLCYLGITLLPLIYMNGKWWEKVTTICLIFLWAGLVVYDIETNRLVQRRYRGLGPHLDAIKDFAKYRGPVKPHWR